MQPTLLRLGVLCVWIAASSGVLGQSADLIARATAGDPKAQYELGIAYGKQEPPDYTRALHWLHVSAGSGNPQAQGALGLIYTQGRGAVRDYAEAQHWLSLAGASDLGAQYWKGVGTNVDSTKAVEWTRRAAEAGNALAHENLGSMYLTGEGVERDFERSRLWLRRAARQGRAKAAFMLASPYFHGFGTPKDPKQAYVWSRVAQDLDPKFMAGHNNIANTLDLDELFIAEDHYKEQREEPKQAAAAWKARFGNSDKLLAVIEEFWD